METMIKSISSFFETRFLITHLTLIPSGLHVLKYIPLRAHYADKTVLEVSTLAASRLMEPHAGMRVSGWGAQ